MAVSKGTSGLVAKYGDRAAKAVVKHANDPTEAGPVRLPPGIDRGIAQVTECKFETYKSGDLTGEYYFRVQAVVVEPEFVEYEGRREKVANRSLQMLMIPVCDSKKYDGTVVSMDENFGKILNEMRKLTNDEFTNGATLDVLEDLAAEIDEAAPYFYFSTRRSKPTKEFPDPKTFESWNGNRGLEEYVPPDPEGTKDETAPPPPAKAPAKNGAAPKATAAPAVPRSTTSAKVPAKKAAPAPAPAEEFDEFGDLATLAEKADAGDKAAAKNLKVAALKAGVEASFIDDANSWGEVVEAMTSTGEGDGGDGGEGEGEETEPPEVGSVYSYAPLDPRTRRKGRAIDVEVTKVYTKKRAADVRSIDNPDKEYNSVGFDELEVPS